MPEIISKYPDVVLEILREAGAQCGTGAKQQILVNCPAENFCSLPTGEFCVYGIDEINQMTQVKSSDFAYAVSGKTSILTIEIIFLILVVFIIGIVIGILIYRSKKK